MPTQSSVHFYLNWAKERIDEMDAALASLEAKASKVQAGSKVKADEIIADLKRHRDEFRAAVEKQRAISEATWERTKVQLEAEWNVFQAQIKNYFDIVGKQIEQQQVTFRDVAAAQVKAWKNVADQIQKEATSFAVERRGAIDAAVRQMKADASEAEVRFEKIKQAGSESWTALSGALAESRNAFDHANEAAREALKRAAAL
jgi:hypothetical protein